jgi:hypothetical protein
MFSAGLSKDRFTSPLHKTGQVIPLIVDVGQRSALARGFDVERELFGRTELYAVVGIGLAPMVACSSMSAPMKRRLMLP